MEPSVSDNRDCFDVAVIGCGIIGAAVTLELASRGLRVVCVERRLGSAASPSSGGNSGIFHCGFDCVPGTLESKLVRRGFERFESGPGAAMRACDLLVGDTCSNERVQANVVFGVGGLCERPLVADWIVRPCGAILVADTTDELRQLEYEALPKAKQNGVDTCVLLTSAAELEAVEPSLFLRGSLCSSSPVGGLWIPQEFAADPWLLCALYVRLAIRHGADIRFGSRCTSAHQVGDGNRIASAWCLEIDGQDIPLFAKTVVNAGGLDADQVEQLRLRGSAAGDDLPSFTVQPRLGEFVVFSTDGAMSGSGPASNGGPRAIILPIPTERTKGVLVAPTALGSCYFVGPTAVDVAQRERPQMSIVISTPEQGPIVPTDTVELSTIGMLTSFRDTRVPRLRECPRAGSYYGLRPGILDALSEYLIEKHGKAGAPAWVTLAGVRSTGLSAALGISEYVASLVASPHETTTSAREDLVWQHTAEELAALLASLFRDDRTGMWFGDVANGQQVAISHPLSIFGLELIRAKRHSRL